jgi:hypothetical protein
MKQEYILDNAIFLSPKVYFLNTNDGKKIYKVKGLSHDVDLNLNDFFWFINERIFFKKNSN